MQVKFKGYKEKSKINISMVIPTGEQKTVITMEMPQGGDWRADMECYDKVLSAYEERLNKAMQSAQQQQAEEAEQGIIAGCAGGGFEHRRQLKW